MLTIDQKQSNLSIEKLKEENFYKVNHLQDTYHTINNICTLNNWILKILFSIEIVRERKMIQYFQILFQSLLFKVLLIINPPQEFKFQDSLFIFNKKNKDLIPIFLLKRQKVKKRVKKKYRKIKIKELFLNHRMNIFYKQEYNLIKLFHWERINNNFFLSLN